MEATSNMRRACILVLTLNFLLELMTTSVVSNFAHVPPLEVYLGKIVPGSQQVGIKLARLTARPPRVVYRSFQLT